MIYDAALRFADPDTIECLDKSSSLQHAARSARCTGKIKERSWTQIKHHVQSPNGCLCSGIATVIVTHLSNFSRDYSKDSGISRSRFWAGKSMSICGWVCDETRPRGEEHRWLGNFRFQDSKADDRRLCF